MALQEQVENFIHRCRSDRWYFFRECFGLSRSKLWKKQEEFIEALWDPEVREINCKGGHSTGKTHIISEGILGYFFVFQPILIILTPTLRQAKHQVWANIRDWYQKSKLPLGGELLETQLKVAPDWYALAFSTRDPNFLRGFKGKNVLLVVDEAQGLEEDLWTAIQGLLAGGTCKIVRNGNPIRTDGAFKNAFGRPSAPGHKIVDLTFSCLETPNYEQRKQVIPGLASFEWVEQRRQEWGEGSIFWDALVAGEFPKIGDDTIISPEWVEQASHNETPELGIKALGVDVARYGHSETVMVAVNGAKAYLLKSFHGQDTMKTVGQARILRSEEEAARIYVDVVGVGGGVVDRLAEVQEPVAGINVGMASFDPDRFVCLRDEVWWHMRELFRAGKVQLAGTLAHDNILKNQLTSIKYKVGSNKKIKVESKEEMKKRGLPSPDRADALALALFASTVEQLVRRENAEMSDRDDTMPDSLMPAEEGEFHV